MIRDIVNEWLKYCFNPSCKGDYLSYTESETEAGPNVKIMFQRKEYLPEDITAERITSWKMALAKIRGVKIHGFSVGNERLYSSGNENSVNEGQSLLVSIELIYREAQK